MSFQNYICWNFNSRPKVMETVALRVEDYIFHATHYPCPINRLNPKSGTKSRYSELELYNDFLDGRIDHSFCVAVGDTGTGKSHLVRWLHNRLTLEEGLAKKNKIVLIKRHSANLAAVLECILEDFDSPEVQKIKDDIQWTHNITKHGACNKVISELAFVLDPENLSSTRLKLPDDDEHELIIGLLPAFLNDQSIRDYLISREDGIINRLADHLSTEKQEFSKQDRAMFWEESDLAFNAAIAQNAGREAKELASTLVADNELKAICIGVLNKAVGIALSNLAGLRLGNLVNALAEIRRTLKKLDKQLILFIEDLSVTQGIDAELIEALLVSPGDGGDDLCDLRSIVGLTNGDYSRLQDNLKDRIHVAVYFNVEMLPNNDSDQIQFGVSDLIDFASRYLNAARYSLSDLEEWLFQNGTGKDCPSFCIHKKCPFVSTCHKIFGEINGRGLYPFTATALERLYRNLAEMALNTSFNPRMLVNNVLDYFLGVAEQKLLDNTFPPKNYLEWFGLTQVGGTVQAQLQNKFGSLNGSRFRTALEIYSKRPFEGKLSPKIVRAFNLPEGGDAEEEVTEQEAVVSRKKTQGTILQTLDEFDVWLNEGTISDSDVNKWRKAIYSAIRGNHDWDASPASYVFYKYFNHINIRIEGQHTQQRTDLVLEIKRKPEFATALRGLLNKFIRADNSTARQEKLYCAEMIAIWSQEVEDGLIKYVYVKGQYRPLQLALQLLFLGVLLHPNAPDPTSERDALRLILSPWYQEEVKPKGTSDLKEVYKAYNKNGEALRKWLHECLGCHKGTSISVTFINTVDLIEHLPSWQRVPLPKPLPEDTSTWNRDYSPLLSLAEKVETYFENAVKKEEGSCRITLKVFQEFFGEQFSKKSLETIQSAFAAGNDQDIFFNTHGELEEKLYSINFEHLENEMKLLKIIADAEITKKKVRAAAKLDRDLIDESINILKAVRNHLEGSYSIIEQKIKIEGIENPQDLYSKITNLFEKLNYSLAQLKG